MQNLFEALNMLKEINLTIVCRYRNKVLSSYTMNACDINETDEYLEFFDEEDNVVRIPLESKCSYKPDGIWDCICGEMMISVLL